MQANVLELILAVNSNALKMGNQSTNTKSLHLLMSKTDCGILNTILVDCLLAFEAVYAAVGIRCWNSP